MSCSLKGLTSIYEWFIFIWQEVIKNALLQNSENMRVGRPTCIVLKKQHRFEWKVVKYMYIALLWDTLGLKCQKVTSVLKYKADNFTNVLYLAFDFIFLQWGFFCVGNLSVTTILNAKLHPFPKITHRHILWPSAVLWWHDALDQWK